MVVVNICDLCGKLYFKEHKQCKPKTMLEYRNETYERDKELGVW